MFNKLLWYPRLVLNVLFGYKSKATKRLLLEALLYIRTLVQTGLIRKELGMCMHIHDYCDKCNFSYAQKTCVLEMMLQMFKLWTLFSGDVYYPVPASRKRTESKSIRISKAASHYHWNNDSKWEGEYGELRKELLDFMITELQRG